MSGGFLERWSRRKLTSAGKALLADAAAPALTSTSAAGPGTQGVQGSLASETDSAPAPVSDAGLAAPSALEAQLPPVEGLTLASDFTGFLKEEVSEALRRQALHKLFADAHFNRMDGLDIYIDDYSLPDPIPPEAMAKLKHAREWLMANEPDAEAASRSPSGEVDGEAVQEGAVDHEGAGGEDAGGNDAAERDAAERDAGLERAGPGGADAPAAAQARGVDQAGDVSRGDDIRGERALEGASAPVSSTGGAFGQKGA
jgi:hypothetical protein